MSTVSTSKRVFYARDIVTSHGSVQVLQKCLFWIAPSAGNASFFICFTDHEVTL